MGAPSQSPRITELDACRGAAMFAVCLSHASDLVAGRWQSTLGADLIGFGMIATPTFLLLSGVICGYLATSMRETESEYRRRLIDRGLFLLLVAHLALGLVHETWEPAFAAFATSFYITDAVGIGLILAGFIARRARLRTLIGAGIAMFAVSWLISYFIVPHDAGARFWIRLLVGLGATAEHDDGFIVPVVPYLGIFIVGIAGGRYYTTLSNRGVGKREMAQACIKIGFACMALVLALKFVWLWLKPDLPHGWLDPLYHLLEPRQKLPPGPAYVLAYGGAGLAMAGILGRMSLVDWMRPVVAMFAVVGRASLLIYVLQYWIYFYPVRALHLGNLHGLIFVVLPVSLAILWMAAWAWDKADGNRLFTLGLRRRPCVTAIA